MDMKKRVTGWRHRLHQTPEPGLEETATAATVAELLEETGIAVHTGIGKTGVVGIIRAGRSERSIGLRADMDGLAIAEQNTCEHISRTPGMMHACGHDGHMAMLLGAAHALARAKDLDGTVYCIFQPGEEHGVGAKAMVEDGLFRRWKIDEVYALHNQPGVMAGRLCTRVGSIMSSETGFVIEISGTGGHAAFPHMLTDPLVAGAQVVTALQTVVSRNMNILEEQTVVSVTEFVTNGGVNIIPSKVTLKGDIRALSLEALEKVSRCVERVVDGQCRSAGVTHSLRLHTGFPATINTRSQTEQALQAAVATVGEGGVDGGCIPFMGSEDFSFLLQEVPGCYLLIGNGIGDEGGVPLHNPLYDFNDNILMTGVEFWVNLARKRLAR